MVGGHAQVVGAVNLVGGLFSSPYHCPDEGAAVYVMYHQNFKKLSADAPGVFYSRFSTNINDGTVAKRAQALDAVVGYKVQKEKDFFAVNVGAAVPVGGESFLGIGAGIDGQLMVYESEKSSLDFLFAARYRHLFPRGVSRELHLASGPIFMASLRRHYYYSLSEIIPGNHIDALFGLRYNYKRFVWDLGGNINAIGQYKFMGKEDGVDTAENTCVYTSKIFLSCNAYTGISFVFKHFFSGLGILIGTNRGAAYFKMGGSF